MGFALVKPFKLISFTKSLRSTPIKLDFEGLAETTIYVNGFSTSVKKQSSKFYRYLSFEDAQRLEKGQSILVKGDNGTILDHVKGRNTQYISASMKEPDRRFNSGHGLIEIDPKGLNFVEHNNVLSSVKSDSKALRDATRAREVLFQKEIPFENIKRVKE